MISQKVYDLCHSENTVSSELAKDPNESPGKIAKKLYGEEREELAHHDHFKDYTISDEDIQKAYECGRWGPTRPSNLFLKV
jgi:guanylate kinase